jgi:tol-pal system protein YbgF
MPLSLPGLRERPKRTLRFAAIVAAGIALPIGLSSGVFADSNPPTLLVAQNTRDAAQLTLRLQALEQQVRDLTGQVQGLQFQVTQLQTLVDRSNQDNDFRFKALEGGGSAAPGKNRAADDAGSLAAPVTPPPNGDSARPARSNLPVADDGGDGGDNAGNAFAREGGAAASDDLGPSADPLVGKGRPGEAPGAEEVPLGPSRGRVDSSAPARPVSVSPSKPAVAADPAAAAQYKAGYDAIVKGNYSFAADQFKQFIKRYPDDPQAPDATNWLGEALLQQQDFVDAADVLVTGYKAYPGSPRAPDMLLKLGIALAGAKQPEASCKTFGLLAQKYPDTTTAFKTRLKQEMTRANCPA